MSLIAKNPGRLDRRVSFRYPVESRGAGGGFAVVWDTSATKAWGEWMPTNGREFVAAAARVDELTGLLRIRYRSDVLPTWRVLVDSATYEVVAVMERGRRDYLDILLKSIIDEVGEAVVDGEAIVDEAGEAIVDEAGEAITS